MVLKKWIKFPENYYKLRLDENILKQMIITTSLEFSDDLRKRLTGMLDYYGLDVTVLKSSFNRLR